MKPNFATVRCLFLFSLLVLFLKSNAADYYGLGGSGNQTDFEHHWATSSGGATFYHRVPVCFDHGVFDVPNKWTGMAGTAWEDPQNWSLGVVPDSSTDVVIEQGTVVVNSKAVCRSLTTGPGVQLIVKSGGSLRLTNGIDPNVSDVVWSKTFGGSLAERFHAITNTTDGGYVMVGSTSSNDGDVSTNHGKEDAWVIKIDAHGNKVWSKVFGGTAEDVAYSIVTSADGGFVMAGTTQSNDGEFTGNHGGNDAWVMKLDADGNKVWCKLYGGSLYDDAVSVVRANGGHYLLAGNTSSTNGIAFGVPAAGGNAWTMKIDGNGEKQWSKLYARTDPDHASTMISTPDDGYVIAGHIWTKGADGSWGYSDSRIMKIDAQGNVQWNKTYGGSGSEDEISVLAVPDGGYLLVGRTNSTDGDIAVNHGEYDALVIRLDASGNKLWSKTFGGTTYDGVTSVIVTSEDGFLLVGRSKSNDGDALGNHGETDGWLMKLNTEGNLQWTKKVGGSRYDATFSVVASTDGGYVLSGYSISNDGDVNLAHPSYEAWVIKVKH